MPYIGKQLVRGQNRKLDDISSGFNGSQTTFTLQIASQNVSVGSALQLWISVGGVIQNPLTDFTIAGNQITFTTAPAASLDFFGVIQGDVTDTNTPGDATVTTSKLATGLTVNLADGSAATSSLQLGGTDSGLFSSAADKVNVTTGGVERLEIGSSEVVFNDGSNDVDFRVESNGNTHMLFVDGGNDVVGIGTSTPLHGLLTLSQSASSAFNALVIQQGNTGSAATDGLHIGIDSGVNAYITHKESRALVFGTANTERMRIDSSGNVGIGLTNPSSEFHVKGAGTVATFEGTGGNGFIALKDSDDNTTAFIGCDGGALKFQTPDNSFSDKLVIDSSGKMAVGIAPSSTASITNVPAGKIQTDGNIDIRYAGTNSTPGGARYLSFVNTDTTLVDTQPMGGIRWVGNDSSNPSADSASILALNVGSGGASSDITFNTGGSEKMRIDSSGRLLVGATSLSDYGIVNAVSNSTSAALRAVGQSSMPNGSAAIKVDKHANVNTTGQVFMAFTINVQNTGSGQINANGASQAAFGSFSDRRLKENIVNIPSQLENICKLRPVEFDYIKSEGGGHQISFIAQEIEKVYPDAIGEREDGMKTLTGWGKTEAILVKALQEAIAKIETLEQRLSDAGIA